MHIQYLKHNEIDKQKWDACVEQSLHPQVYALSWYLDICAPGWDALVIDDYAAVFPLPHRRKVFRYLFQPRFSQQLGLFNKSGSQSEMLKMCLKAIPSKFRFIDLYLNHSNTSLQLKHGKIHMRKNYVLPLNQDYTHLFKFFSDHCKRHLKKASKNELSYTSISKEEMVAAYKRAKGKETFHVSDADYKILTQLLGALTERGMLQLVALQDKDGKLHACAAFVFFSMKVYYLIGCTTESGKDSRSMYHIFNDMIMQHAGSKNVLDFEGSEIPGIARFFKGFGAVKQYYYHMRINRLPWPFSLLKG